MASNELIRIQKIIADAGIASRRKAEELIQKGLVKVNGKTVTLGDKANPKKDEIIVQGRKLIHLQNLKSIMLCSINQEDILQQ